MNRQDIADRARRIAAQNFPGVPFQSVCSLIYYQTLADGGTQYRCSVCGDTQIVSELIGATETRECRGAKQ